MGLKRTDESPTVADTVIIEIKTPNASGCFLDNPYKVDKVTIYYVELGFSSDKIKQYENYTYDPVKLAKVEKAEALACTNPTDDNLNEAIRLRTELNASAQLSYFYYDEAKPVAIFGIDSDEAVIPAWLSTDESEALITNIPEDDEGNAQYGVFELEWDAVGQREGNYFACWTWTPNIAGDSLSAHSRFALGGSTALTTSIPTHFTIDDKYETLLDRYLPSMFKTIWSDNDLTTDVLEKFNGSIADGFTLLEDLANQLVDLLDANATQEALLPHLANLFNLRLKSNDPTLWRRQIKRAVPLLKKKGTYSGLSEALDQAGIRLTKLTKLWQVVSKYTWQESFQVGNDDNTSFVLSKTPILPIDTDNFELYFRAFDDTEYIELNSDYVEFSIVDGQVIMTWIGDALSVNPVILISGDIVRVVYQIDDIPNDTEQTIENYIRSLPVADSRDEKSQTYPLKNWNVRLIEEDDALFDVVVRTRHPLTDKVIFGQVRTEFPFSENIYNMDEYNGSTRDSTKPCDIDKNFLDQCGACQSSWFNIDLEVQDLSDDRIQESQEIINEFKPFHAQLNTINYTGAIYEFIEPPVETIECLIQLRIIDRVISGNAQTVFSRTMEHGLTTNAIRRNVLADVTTEAVDTGIAVNTKIIIFCPDVRFNNLGVAEAGENVLEILTPSANSGVYTVSDPQRNYCTIDAPSGDFTDAIGEPLNESAFTFRLSNNVYTNSTTTITQDDIFQFSDPNSDLTVLGIKTAWDVEHDETYTGGAWKINISDPAGYIGEYSIIKSLPDGSVLLSDPTDLLTPTNTTGLTYTVIPDGGDDPAVYSGTSGKLQVTRRALITVTDGVLTDVRALIKLGDFTVYNGSQYEIIGFKENDLKSFYINSYSDGDAAGATIDIYRRLVSNVAGYVSYMGIKLTAPIDYEDILGIQNGANATGYPWNDEGFMGSGDGLEDNSFKENFLILIDTSYYAISDIDGTEITLDGPVQNWLTTGTSVDFTIYKYSKAAFTVPDQHEPDSAGHEFESIDRRGGEIITATEEDELASTIVHFLNNKDNDSQITDFVSQNESISYTIEYRDQE